MYCMITITRLVNLTKVAMNNVLADLIGWAGVICDCPCLDMVVFDAKDGKV